MQRAKSFLNMRKRLTVLLEYTLGIYIHLTANHKGVALAETKKISHCKCVVTTVLISAPHRCVDAGG